MTRAIGKPRGLLRPAAADEAQRHERMAPPAALEAYLEHYWFVEWDLRGKPPELRETLPHPNVHLVVERGRTRIFGVHEGRFARTLEGTGTVFGIKFSAGGFRPFARQSVSRYSNRSTPVDSVFGPAGLALEEDVMGCDSPAAMAGIASRLLTAQMPEPDAKVALARSLVQMVLEDPAITTVEEIARRAQMGRRALQRLFAEYVGVGPKWVINRYRLHEAIERVLRGDALDWATLALELGYYDQAHFIRDFRQLVGRTPGEFARAEAP